MLGGVVNSSTCAHGFVIDVNKHGTVNEVACTYLFLWDVRWSWGGGGLQYLIIFIHTAC